MSGQRIAGGVRLAMTALLLLGGANRASAQEAAGEPIIGEMFLETIPVRHYLSASFETDFAAMGPPLVEKLTAMMEGAREEKVSLLGGTVHVYHGAPHRTPDMTFRMETGFFVWEGAPPVGEFDVRELPELRCASLLYVGPVTRLGEAWQAIYRAVNARGLTPTEDERELTLYWEGAESPNNVFQVQLGVEE
jgi:DNA gyrase inhibitor GyrI